MSVEKLDKTYIYLLGMSNKQRVFSESCAYFWKKYCEILKAI